MRTFLALVGNLLVASAGIIAPARSSVPPPSAGHVLGLVGHPQSLPLDCEARSAADWAAYWGVSVEERAFFQQLPKTDDPETGFVGDVYDSPGLLPPRGYGVYAEPVAALLQAYGLQAEAQSDATSTQLQSEIAGGRPVILWFLFGLRVRAPVHLTASDGRIYPAAPFEHTGILIGYDPGSFTLVEAFSGRVERLPRDKFLASWAVLGNQAVFGSGPARPIQGNSSSASLPTLSPPNGIAPTTPIGIYIVRPGDTLAGIAQHYGLSWTSLASENQILWPYALYPGQRLYLPAGSSPEPAHTHIVQPGESLTSIARAYGLPWRRLAALNGLRPPYRIYPEQALRLS